MLILREKIILGLFIAICSAAVIGIVWNSMRLLWDWAFRLSRGKRVTSFFILLYKKRRTRIVIEQNLSSAGERDVRAFRRKNRRQPLSKKLFAASKFFSKELSKLISALPDGVAYDCTTHLLHQLLHAEKKELIKINSKHIFKRRLLKEMIPILGFADFLRCVFSPQYRSRLVRNFYRIKFTKLDSATPEKKKECT